MRSLCKPSRTWIVFAFCVLGWLFTGCTHTDSDGEGDTSVVGPDSNRDISLDFGTGRDGSSDVSADTGIDLPLPDMVPDVPTDLPPDSPIDAPEDDGTDTTDTGESDMGLPGRIAIFLAGDDSERTFTDSASGQTPRDFDIALSAYYVQTSRFDNSRALCFDLGDTPAIADMSGDNLIGSCLTSSIPTGTYTHGRVKVDWLRYTIDGTLHAGEGPDQGEYDLFRAMSNTEYEGTYYTANTGYIAFSGLISFSLPLTFPPMSGGGMGIDINMELGKLWMTFPYSSPLPIDASNLQHHWARFHWELYESFRWIDTSLEGHSPGVWDTRYNIADSEQVVGSGFNGYHITSSLD